MPGQYTPRLKTGQTFEHGYYDDGPYIVIGTHEQLWKYSGYYSQRDDFDDSIQSHTRYFCYLPESYRFSRVMDFNNNVIPYCLNSERGLKILRSIVPAILDDIAIVNMFSKIDFQTNILKISKENLMRI